MPARRAAPRTRYDGAAYRALREAHRVSLDTILHTAEHTVGFEVATHEHVRQWERGQRNISDRLARILANALTENVVPAGGVAVTPADFQDQQAAA